MDHELPATGSGPLPEEHAQLFIRDEEQSLHTPQQFDISFKDVWQIKIVIFNFETGLISWER